MMRRQTNAHDLLDSQSLFVTNACLSLMLVSCPFSPTSCHPSQMIMESFSGLSHKFDYSIVGHDGSSPLIPLVDWGKPPKTQPDRMAVIEAMMWNASFCERSERESQRWREGGRVMEPRTIGATNGNMCGRQLLTLSLYTLFVCVQWRSHPLCRPARDQRCREARCG